MNKIPRPPENFGPRLLEVLERKPRSLSELSRIFQMSQMRLRTAIAPFIESGHVEQSRQIFLLGPSHDARTQRACGDVALDLVRRAIRPGIRYTGHKLTELTGLERTSVNQATSELVRIAWLRVYNVQNLAIYERM